MIKKNSVYVYRKNYDFSFIKVNPGDWVVIKPNLIKECKETDPEEWECVITDGSLIEQVCRAVCEKLEGKGRVTICDAPQTDSSFKKIEQLLGLYDIADRLSNEFSLQVDVYDLRNEEWTNKEGVIVDRKQLEGDPNGTIAFNLSKDSLFYEHQQEGGYRNYYGADYDSKVVNKHHHGKTQEYLICGTPIKADVFINMPKLKTHKKTGVTLSLKNLVGINADKNWLPHHTEGGPSEGGDQFPEITPKRRLEQKAVAFARKLALNVPIVGPYITRKLRSAGELVFGETQKVIRSGNWYGNDTTWRMVLDLNRCLLYGNSDGTLRRNNPKRYYSIIDGIIGMEGDGPMQGDKIHSNVVICGLDPVATDMVAARVMGFDWRKLAVIREAFNLDTLPITDLKPEDILVQSDVDEWNGKYLEIEDKDFLNFKPHFGWTGHIEYE